VSAKDAHRVVAWKEVGATTGTGIVHIAPGCGKEDFQLGTEVGLPPVAPLDDAGVFLPGFGWLTGLSAVDPRTADRILEDLKTKGRLFATESYGHSYPHCWRCKTELLFRLVDEWFIGMKWRGEIMDVTRQVTFLPAAIQGDKRELKWLEQMHDWMISKKRFWGLALPIWVDEKTGEFEVIGSRAELKERAVEGWQDFEGHTPHRPWIDKVKIRNPRNGNLMSRIPDVGNPWLDAGIVPYSTMGYNRDRAYWEKWFPAAFITESFPGQFRNWFYAILAMSTMMEHRPPFRTLLGHALVRDAKGETMSKSKGNSIPFDDAADRMSADLMRWMFSRHNPAANINFGYGPAEELRSRFTLKLWNSYAFFCNNARQAKGGFDLTAPEVPVSERPDIDRWILSDLQVLIQTARREFENFNIMAFCLQAEEFVDDKLSNWYVRRNRRRFWKSEQGQDKLAAYKTLYTVLTTLAKLFAPIMPFLSEAMYKNLVPDGSRNDVSIHLQDFPQADPSLIDEDLSRDMEALLRLVNLGSAARNTVKIKRRQPLAEMKVQPSEEQDAQGNLRFRDRRAVERFADQICEELNIKKVSLHDPAQGPLLGFEVKPNMKTLGPKFGPRLKEVVTALANADPCELARKFQAGESVTLASPGGPVELEPADVVIQLAAPSGWAGVADRGTQVAVDTRLSEALKQEGMARDVVRHVQDLRKTANLEMEDRILLHLATEAPALQQAIKVHQGYIGGETLATLSPRSLEGKDVHPSSVKIDGHPLTIQLRKVAKP
jgi:isoleucyl-tRNA synthetase